ncbi:MAG TPA: OmpA family protein [Humisphaera sp.]
MGLLGFGVASVGRHGASSVAAKALLMVAGGSLGLIAAGGCQNPVAAERDKLYMENRELRAQNEALRSVKATDAGVTAPEPVKPPAPPPTTIAVERPTPQPPVLPPVAPPPATPDLGGDETKVDAAGNTTVSFVGETLFKSGSAILEAPAKQNLSKLLSGLKGQYSGRKVEVQGHTDSDPIKVSKWKSNQELSEARAKAVKEYLIANGIESSRVSSKGFGDTKPKTTDPKHKAQNRRVEVVVLSK